MLEGDDKSANGLRLAASRSAVERHLVRGVVGTRLGVEQVQAADVVEDFGEDLRCVRTHLVGEGTFRTEAGEGPSEFVQKVVVKLEVARGPIGGHGERILAGQVEGLCGSTGIDRRAEGDELVEVGAFGFVDGNRPHRDAGFAEEVRLRSAAVRG